jgi:hypothetical protein
LHCQVFEDDGCEIDHSAEPVKDLIGEAQKYLQVSIGYIHTFMGIFPLSITIYLYGSTFMDMGFYSQIYEAEDKFYR